MEKKLIDYNKLIAFLEKRREYYSKLADKQLADDNVRVDEYAETIAKWSVYYDLIYELSKAPF